MPKANGPAHPVMSGAVCVQRGFRVSVPAGFGEACGLAAGVAAACDDGIEDHAGCGEGNAEVERESLLSPKSRTVWLYNQPVPYFLRVAAR